MRELLPYFSLAIAVIACGISTWTAVRAGRWRDSEAAQALVSRIAAVEGKATLSGQRLDQLEADILSLPSKADFARLEGEVNTTCKIADRTEKAVNRIEDWWLRSAK